MKGFASGRVAQAAAKYGEVAPNAAVCCNACRTCVPANLLGVALVGVSGAVAAARRYLARPA